MARFVAWLAGAIVVLLLGSSVAIFGLGYFEPGWGRAYALQVAVFVSAALAVIGAAAYTVVSIARHFHPTLLQALVAGALFQLCLFGAIEGIQRAAPALDSLAMAAVIAAALGAA